MDDNKSKICNKPGCTYSQTGTCILNNDPLTCPDRIESLSETLTTKEELEGGAILPSPIEAERFSASLTISIDAAQLLMQSSYCKVIGILGVPGTGKTASLVSLYLLLAHNSLKNYDFRNSKSLMAFEEISRGARKWVEGDLPEHLTTHTELKDERTAGFLHLRIGSTSDKKVYDFLFTDLPGEWTTSLIDTNRTDRLSFLKSAERILLVINAEEIHNLATRKQTIHRLKLLIERLSNFLSPNMPDITIVLTHCDEFSGVDEFLSGLNNEYNGFDIKILEIASFSSNESVNPGTGISELIYDLIISRKESLHTFWPKQKNNNNDRAMLKYGINNKYS